MEKSKKNKNNVWVYAVILFTSAFIVLLLTAYSQIKFTNNMDNIKKRLSEEEKVKLGYEKNYKKSGAENQKLKEILKEQDKLIEDLKTKEKELEDRNAGMEEANKKYSGITAQLFIAEEYYDNKDFVNCAITLLNIPVSDINDNVLLGRYDYLRGKTFSKASSILYHSGLKEYKSKRYEGAIEFFNKTLDLSKTEYFSDDAQFLMAMSYYYLGNKDKCVEYLETLLIDYPENTYKKDAADMLGSISK